MGTAIIILAAGRGTRFGDIEINKNAVLYKGKSLIQRGIDNVFNLVDKIIVVVGYKKETVIESIQSKWKSKIVFVEQKRLWGTGYAVKTTLPVVDRFNPDNILVANGDHLFMIKNRIISRLVEEHNKEGNEATILSSICNNTENIENGRIIRKGKLVTGIVEKTEFNSEIRAIKELNSGTYIFKYQAIKKVLAKAKREKGRELYLTDMIFKLKKVGAIQAGFEEIGAGVNTKKELAAILLDVDN